MTTDKQEAHKRAQYVLALDTSSRALTVAFIEQGKVAVERSVEAERNHSIQLLPEVQRMLDEVGAVPAQLEAVVVGHGPGSYTGTRIGVSVAKTFAWALGIPVVAVSSLEGLARAAAQQQAAASDETVWYVPLLDARRGQAFSAVYRWSSGEWSCEQPDGIRVMAEWQETIAALLEQARREGNAPDRICFVGEVDPFAALVAGWEPMLGIPVTAVEQAICASAIAEAAQQRIAAKQWDDTHRLVPNYTQLAEAEVKLLQKERQGGDTVGGSR